MEKGKTVRTIVPMRGCSPACGSAFWRRSVRPFCEWSSALKPNVKQPRKPYRKNVCAVLVNNTHTRVLVFRRANDLFAKHRWQFPQGGLDAGETPRAGVLRELKEEIGTNDVELLARTKRPIAYDYPPDVAAQLAADGSKLARYRGQIWRRGHHFDLGPARSRQQ